MNKYIAKLFIDGEWVEGSEGNRLPIYDPACSNQIGEVCVATEGDLDRALEAAQVGMSDWRNTSPWDKGTILHEASRRLRARAEEVGKSITREQGKPLREAIAEVDRAADFLEWGAAEARRLHNREHTGRTPGSVYQVRHEPIGVVAAFTPWNFPIVQLAKKVAALLAAGCSCVAKPAEETPSSCVMLVEELVSAGVPPRAINLVFGLPDHISSHLIASPIVRKITFTGSVPVGKILAAKAGEHMKPATMELGGHAPVIVFNDVDVGQVAEYLVARKFVNAGQVCVAPTRFYVDHRIHDEFVSRFTALSSKLKVGDGLNPNTTMGPLANQRRVDAVEEMISEAVDKGAKVHLGGKREGNRGFFFSPTVLSDVSPDCQLMHQEPFGPVAPVCRFDDEAEVLTRANALNFGLSSYLFTSDERRQRRMAEYLQAGVIGVNNVPFHLPELPFGGWKDSGYGTEGGIEMLQSYLRTKVVSIEN